MKSSAKYVVVTALLMGTFFVVAPKADAAPALKISAMASANSQKGAKYVYGAEGGYSRGYDCSGLTYWSYKQHHKTLPRTAQAQFDKSKHIAPANRQVGDLIFIRDSKGHVYHVGIFTGVRGGKGYMLNANFGRTTAHKVGEWPIVNYTDGPSYASYGRY